MMKSLIVYIIAYLSLLVFVLCLLCTYPKPELHLMLNSWHTSTEDTFFKYYSMLAEWPLYVLALLPILWKKIEMTVLFAFSELTGGAVLQVLKHAFSFERPASVFEHYPDMILPVVDGVNMHHGNSFPSGHASTFFVFFTCCALILAYHYKLKAEDNSRRRELLLSMVMLLLVALAALGGYSRIYLSQHFLSDVCMGSIIGFVTPLLIFFYARNIIYKLISKIYRTR